MAGSGAPGHSTFNDPNRIESEVDCAPYAGRPAMEQYCAYLQALGLASPEEAVAACARAGEWEHSCRGEWVAVWSRHDRSVDAGAYLSVCGDNHDCAFELIDTRPSSDVLVDIERCDRHTGPYARDCVKHRLNRWLDDGPDTAEVARLAAAETAHAGVIGQAVAHCAAGLGVGSCEGAPDVAARCGQTAEDIRQHPERCAEGPVFQ